MGPLPTFPDEPNYTMRTTLDGTAYLLTFRFSERSNVYFVDLALDDGTPLVSGQKVLCGKSLWKRSRYDSRVPQGACVCFPNSGDDSPPGVGELGIGRRCTLYYSSSGDIAAMLAIVNAAIVADGGTAIT